MLQDVHIYSVEHVLDETVFELSLVNHTQMFPCAVFYQLGLSVVLFFHEDPCGYLGQADPYYHEGSGNAHVHTKSCFHT